MNSNTKTVNIGELRCEAQSDTVFNHSWHTQTFYADLGWGMVSCGMYRCKATEFEAAARLADAAPKLLAALSELIADGECYCLPRSEGGNGEACGHCKAIGLVKTLNP